jgi:hypothetical protein
MEIYLGKIKCITVKDSGASATTIPESVALLRVINEALVPGSETCVVELIEFEQPVRLQGFAAGQVVEVCYGMVVKTTFRGIAGKSVTVPIDYRVIPMGLDTGKQILLGAGTIGPDALDV